MLDILDDATVEVSEKDVLIRARALIPDEAHWTRHVFARDKDGFRTSYDSDDAVCFCVRGAVARARHELGMGDFVIDSHCDVLARAADDLYGMYPTTVNDDYGYMSVIKMLNHAIERAG